MWTLNRIFAIEYLREKNSYGDKHRKNLHIIKLSEFEQSLSNKENVAQFAIHTGKAYLSR